VWVTLRVTVMQPLERAQVKLRARGPVKPQRSLQLVKLTLLVTVLRWVCLLPVRALRQGRSPEWMLVSVRALASLSESVLLLPLMWVLAQVSLLQLALSESHSRLPWWLPPPT
jgi:hypothetical protein